MESTSAAARSLSLTRATESVGSCASIWAATPETCGVAMLVPLMVLVAVLLEPTHAPGMSEPGACAHARRGLRVAAGGRAAGGRWRANMHGWARGGRGGGLRPARGRTRRSWRSRRHRRCWWWSQRAACRGWYQDCSTMSTNQRPSCPRRPRPSPALRKGKRGVSKHLPHEPIAGFRVAWVLIHFGRPAP